MHSEQERVRRKTDFWEVGSFAMFGCALVHSDAKRKRVSQPAGRRRYNELRPGNHFVRGIRQSEIHAALAIGLHGRRKVEIRNHDLL